MMEKHYRIAGMEFSVEMPAALMYENDRRLAPFRVPRAEHGIRFRFEKAERLSPPRGAYVTHAGDKLVYEASSYFAPVGNSWEKCLFRTEEGPEGVQVQLRADAFPGSVPARTALDAFAVEHRILRQQGVLFHCAFIERDGKAVLFTAPSQTGKSTQAELWKQHRGAPVINGDRAALRIVRGRVLAEGVPFCGSSPYCENRSLPVEAIVYLAQAPATTVRKLRGFEAFSRVWEGISVNTWDRQDLELASDIVKTVAESVPVYHMPCTPDEGAVQALEETLRKQVNP